MFRVVTVLLTTSLIMGCALTQSEPIADNAAPRVQLLGFDSCPNTPVMHQRLLAAFARLNVSEPVEVIDQEAIPDDDPRRGWPAPTVLVDGGDLFGTAAPRNPAMGCRMYQGPGGVPSVNELARRLANAGLGGDIQ
jgi:hypothetical protein